MYVDLRYDSFFHFKNLLMEFFFSLISFDCDIYRDGNCNIDSHRKSTSSDS